MAIKRTLPTLKSTITTSASSLTQRLEDMEFLLLSKFCSSKAGAHDSVWAPTSRTEPSVLHTGLWWADAGQAELELQQDRNNRKNNAGDPQRCGNRKRENRIEPQDSNNCQTRADLPSYERAK